MISQSTLSDRFTSLLAEIDPRDVRNNYNQVQADLEVARARLEISEAQLERSNQLLTAEVITQQEHESARIEYANSRASLVRAETNYELAELQMQDVSITAPMSGTVIQKNVEEGAVIQSASQNVSGGTTLFLMANLGEMQVRTLVDETDMGMLEPGMAAAVIVEAFPERTFNGTIEKIEPQAVVDGVVASSIRRPLPRCRLFVRRYKAVRSHNRKLVRGCRQWLAAVVAD